MQSIQNWSSLVADLETGAECHGQKINDPKKQFQPSTLDLYDEGIASRKQYKGLVMKSFSFLKRCSTLESLRHIPSNTSDPT